MPIPVEADFTEDLRQSCIRALAKMGVRHAALNTVTDACHAYYNVDHRAIRPGLRSVHRSAKLLSLPLAESVWQAIENIAGESERGENLNPRLSRQLLNAEKNDGLRNEWGIHHLHLGDAIEEDGFRERTKLVLLVCPVADAMYFLDVRPHGNATWGDRELIDLLQAEFPDAVAPYRIDGWEAEDNYGSPQEQVQLRRVGITFPYVASSGASYTPPGGGFTVGGGSASVAELALDACRQAHRLQQLFSDRADDVHREIASSRSISLERLRLRLVGVEPATFRIRELQSGVEFRQS